MEEREKKERVMCLIGHVSNFDWGNGQNGGKEMEVSFSFFLCVKSQFSFIFPQFQSFPYISIPFLSFLSCGVG